jgi:hypothetical protein
MEKQIVLENIKLFQTNGFYIKQEIDEENKNITNFKLITMP